ncbi:TDT family transporter [Curtobacterium sp. PhB136]|uniref:SLAC1 family transporter n=1 Tax=Curtobacterium sp. PhB136 TaxID=2485181 RepID=UPI002441BAED|nr:TDT family transporter [Curtobacterium sp. PhB136]
MPLGWFAMPLGLAGVGSLWTAAGLGSGGQVASEVSTALAGVLWLAFTVNYLVVGLRQRFLHRAHKHPIQGPLIAYVPVIGLLLGIHYGMLQPEARPWFIWSFVALLALVDAVLLGHWLSGGISPESLHAGYYLPVVAGPFIASIGLHAVGAGAAAWAEFGAGVFFLLVFGGVIFTRLISRAPLTPALLPSTAILLAAPATAAIAWMDAEHGRFDAVAAGLVGVMVMMLLVQLTAAAQYVSLPLAMNWWTFSFPIASSANVAVRVLIAEHSPHSAVGAVAVVITVLVAFLAAGTVMLVIRHTRADRARPVARTP